MKSISSSAKRAYFLRYFGCDHKRKMMYHNGESRIVGPYKTEGDAIGMIDRFWATHFTDTKDVNDFLILRDIKSLTRAEAEVLRIRTFPMFTGDQMTDGLFRLCKDVFNRPHLHQCTVDVLVFFGIATPLYDVENDRIFTVDDLVKLEVVKIIQ